MQTITAIVPAKNEEANIVCCIKSLSWCDEILVLATGTDRTSEVARGLGAKVIDYHCPEENGLMEMQRQFNTAVRSCQTDWVLRVDADEQVTPELENEITSILKAGATGTAAYGIGRMQFFWGGYLSGGDWYYDRLVRLFRPDCASYDPIVPVHEQLRVVGKVDYLKERLKHNSHPRLSVAIEKFNTYTSIEASMLNISINSAYMKMVFFPIYIFLRWLFWNRGYRDGMRGVAVAICRAFYEFLVYAKYIEMAILSDSKQAKP